MVHILFVCTGNICRSPMAEGVFENVARREELQDEVTVDSAGTHGFYYAGKPPDPRAQESLLSRGIDISAQRARLLAPEDCERYDYILTMDEHNYKTVSSLCRGRAVVRPFLDYATDSPEREVPDPYHGGPHGFEYVLDLIELAAEGLLDDIRARHLSRRA
jgi:protein-tyrosine phosphatase